MNLWLAGPLLTLVVCASAYAYEEETHAVLTSEALNRSILARDPGLLPRLGLEPNLSQRFPASNSVESTIEQLLQKGVQDEDAGVRVINHFFDPTRAAQSNNGALVIIPGLTPPFLRSSPTWALEDTVPAGQNLNDFSYRDARQSFLDALTGEFDFVRRVAFGRMFETLGHVIHHQQDMAQPQHVRNDDHCKELVCTPFLHRPSHFERYSSTRSLIDLIPNLVSSANYGPVYNPSSPGAINSPRRFWSTGDGKGIAEFTNRNFVSARTNFCSENGTALPYVCFDSPVPAESRSFTIGQAYEAVFGPRVPVPAQILTFCGAGSACDVDVFATRGVDALKGNPLENQFASSASLFDEDLRFLPEMERPIVFDLYCNRSYAPERIFTLNRLNHDSALTHLVPRAVEYSAGMINYFFRGRLAVGGIPSDPGNQYLLNPNPEAMNGTFTVYFDGIDGRRHRHPSTPFNVSLPAAGPGGPTQGRRLFLREPRFPVAPAQPIKYTLAFNGTLGEERTSATDTVGAVIGQQVAVVYAPLIVTERTYSGSVSGPLGIFPAAPGPDEGAVEAAAVERFRDALRQDPIYGPAGCSAFTYALPEWMPVSIQFGIEMNAERQAGLQFPQHPHCDGLRDRYTLHMVRQRGRSCPDGHDFTSRDNLPVTLEEACYTLK